MCGEMCIRDRVIGMGEEKTPQPFISACNQFKYLDLLYANQQEEEEAEKLREAKHSSEQAETGSGKKKNGRKRGDIRRIRGTINAILEKFSDEDGCCLLYTSLCLRAYLS